MAEIFDPFSDRLARDIRNSLSTALVAQLTRQPHAQVEEVVDSWLARVRQSVYRDYIDDCRRRYYRLWIQLDAHGIHDPCLQAVELWNGGLFFELHELLETVWHKAHGVERTGLKGLIQAAGVYVHRERGNQKAAGGLARRARTNLKTGRSRLGFVSNLDTLLHRLKNPADAPPELIPKSIQ